MSTEKSTAELILEIERKDRRFRIAQAVFMSMVIVALIGLSLFVYVSAERQIARLDGESERRRQDTQLQLNDVKKYVRCLADIFAKHKPGTVKIQDLNPCEVTERRSAASPAPTDSILWSATGRSAGSEAEPQPTADNQDEAQPDPPSSPKPNPDSDPDQPGLGVGRLLRGELCGLLNCE